MKQQNPNPASRVRVTPAQASGASVRSPAPIHPTGDLSGLSSQYQVLYASDDLRAAAANAGFVAMPDGTLARRPALRQRRLGPALDHGASEGANGENGGPLRHAP